MTDSNRQRPPQADARRPIPAFINPGSGSVEQLLSLLDGDTRIKLHCLPPTQLAEAIDEAVKQGLPRVVVGGGDGTLALAASRLAGTRTELAVLPGGTLNHFAARLGLPGALEEALELALNGYSRPVEVGYVNDHLFINTSSVGAYVFFVRTRDYLERRMSYHVASLLAGIRRLVRFRSARIDLNGIPLRTPLVFIGVGERELRFPVLGQEKNEGRTGLHLVAIKSNGRLETFNLAFNAIFRGVDPLERAKQVENQILEKIELTYRKEKRQVTVATDGELIKLTTPLRYRFAAGDLAVVMAPDAG